MLPGYKREMLKHMPIGSYLKFIFVFDKVLVRTLFEIDQHRGKRLGILERRRLQWRSRQ